MVILKNKIFIIISVIIILISFSYGFISRHFQLFPYNLIYALYSTVEEPEAPGYREITKEDIYWANEVKKGGYILHFRHAQREKWTDVTAFDGWELINKLDASKETFSRATCLTPRGVEEAKLIGNIFKLHNIKVSQIITSPSCRARQTSIHAFGSVGTIVNSLLHRTAMSPVQHEDMANNLRNHVNKIEVLNGENVILSGHGGTLRFDETIFFDSNEVGELDDRHEGGFIIIEKTDDGKIVAKYKYKTFRRFAVAAIELETN